MPFVLDTDPTRSSGKRSFQRLKHVEYPGKKPLKRPADLDLTAHTSVANQSAWKGFDGRSMAMKWFLSNPYRHLEIRGAAGELKPCTRTAPFWQIIHCARKSRSAGKWNGWIWRLRSEAKNFNILISRNRVFKVTLIKGKSKFLYQISCSNLCLKI